MYSTQSTSQTSSTHGSTPGGVVIDLTSLGLPKESSVIKPSTHSTHRRVQRLFHLPVLLSDSTGAEGEEASLLLDESKRRPHSGECSQCDSVARVSWAVCPLITTLLMASILGVVVVVFMKLDSGIKTIDASVDLTSTASSMLKNMNGILHSGASLAQTADKLGLKAVNLTYVRTYNSHDCIPRLCLLTHSHSLLCVHCVADTWTLCSKNDE